MKLLQAINIAEDCGLTTIGEAKLNIEMHAISIFNYDNILNELKELDEDINRIVFNNGFELDENVSSIKHLLLEE